MLDANGITAENRFVILETPLIDGMLPSDAYQPVRDWLTETATRTDRRVAVLSQTMSGVLDTFKSRVPAMAAHVEAQVVLRAELRRTAEASYERAFAEANADLKNGTLLTGEVLARWQDCVVGDGVLQQHAPSGIAAPATVHVLGGAVRDGHDERFDRRTQRRVERRVVRRAPARALALHGGLRGLAAAARPQVAADHAVLPARQHLAGEQSAVLQAGVRFAEGPLVGGLRGPPQLRAQHDLRHHVGGHGRDP